MNRETPQPVYQHPSGIEIFEKIWWDGETTVKEFERECADENSPVRWERASVQGYDLNKGIDDIRTNEHLCISDYAEQGNKSCQFMHNQLADLFEALTQSYMYRHKILGVDHTHEPYMMLKYSEGQYFDSHVDGMPGSPRFISAILYLNDDYEGGELEFVNYDLKIKMPKESVIIFPSNFPYVHKSHPITKGHKYSVASWLTLSK